MVGGSSVEIQRCCSSVACRKAMMHWGANSGSSEYKWIFVPFSLTHAERGGIAANLLSKIVDLSQIKYRGSACICRSTKIDTSDQNVSAIIFFFSDRKPFLQQNAVWFFLTSNRIYWTGYLKVRFSIEGGHLSLLSRKGKGKEKS